MIQHNMCEGIVNFWDKILLCNIVILFQVRKILSTYIRLPLKTESNGATVLPKMSIIRALGMIPVPFIFQVYITIQIFTTFIEHIVQDII